MAANANVEVDMLSAMQTISPFSLSCNQIILVNVVRADEGEGLGRWWIRWAGWEGWGGRDGLGRT